MVRWIPYAFVRITVFFIAGILMAVYQPAIIPFTWALIFFIAGLAAYCTLFIFSRLSKSWINPGYLGLSLIFLTGYTYTCQRTDSLRPDNLSHLKEDVLFYQATISAQPQEKPRTWKAEAYVCKVKTVKGWRPFRGNVLLYFSKKDFAKPYRYGDVLLIKGHFQEVPAPGNPGEFDYQTFLRYRKIYHQHFVKHTSVETVGYSPSYTIVHYAILARMWADSTLRHHVYGTREQAIASALVLGVTDGLDNDLLTAYAATGAMHVLSVSGLHVSIVYLLIVWMLKPFNRFHWGKWVLAIISLTVLWCYAFVTGGSPSVLRAVVMFSFMAIARVFQRNTNIYNVLAASAFCLLIAEPYFIMSVGFQLSYLAVLGIVWLQPGLYSMWQPKSWLGNEVWKVTSVSIAAQVATLPLGFLYFHQFPNYFLIANLLVIPGSFVVLIAGLAVLAVGFMAPIATVAGYILELSIKFVNVVVFTVERFPFSVTDGIYITIFQSWLLSGIIILLVLLWRHRKVHFLYGTLALIIFYTAVQWIHSIRDVRKQQFTIYKIPGHYAIDFFDQGQTIFHADSALYNDPSRIQFHILPNRIMHGIEQVQRASPSQNMQGGKVWMWNKRVIVQIHHPDFILSAMPVHYLVISNNALTDLEIVCKILRPQIIILDSSNSTYFAERLQKQAATLKIEIYSVLHRGAYTSIL